MVVKAPILLFIQRNLLMQFFWTARASIARTAFVNEIDASSRYDIINAQVHYGQYGGLPVKVVYCLFGLTGGLLSITGFCCGSKERKAKDRV